MSKKTIITALMLNLAGCASTAAPLEQSNSINDYYDNAASIQGDGSKIYDQYAVKALFVKNIIESTEWPEGKKQKLRLCIIGDDNFHGKLEKIASLVKKEKGQEWEIKRGIGESDVKYCDVLYSGFMYSDRELRGFLNRAADKPTLTIGDDKYFEREGGMVSLQEKNSHIVMTVNFEEARKSGFKFNKEMVQVATNAEK
jgi:hypothetical protein